MTSTKFFKRVEVKLDYLVVCDKIRDGLPDNWEFINDLFYDRMGVLLPLLAVYAPFKVVGDNCVVSFSDTEITVSLREMNAFFSFFSFELTYEEFNSKIYIAYEMVDPEFDFRCRFRRDVSQHENGQAKIMLGTLECLLNEPSNQLSILVIGSSSADTSVTGVTYRALAEQLTNAGYFGLMELYDPYETERQCTVGNFTFVTHRELFDYDKGNGKQYTHVFDDAWAEQITSSPKSLEFVGKRIGTIPEGKSKFVYYMDGNTCVFKAGLKSHKDSEGYAGGVVIRTGVQLYITSTSLTYGHYSRYVLERLLGDKYSLSFDNTIYRHGHFSVDPGYNIINLYPNAKVSVKYQDEIDPSGAVVIRQHYYNGKERRILFNVIPRHPEFNVGCNCDICNTVYGIQSNFVSYSTVPSVIVIGNLLDCVVEKRCAVRRGISFRNVLTKIKSHAAKGDLLSETRRDLILNQKVTPKVFDRALSLLLKHDALSLQNNSVDFDTSKYIFQELRNGITVRYCRNKTRYMRVINGVCSFYYSDTNQSININLRGQRLVYYPNKKNTKTSYVPVTTEAVSSILSEYDINIVIPSHYRYRFSSTGNPVGVFQTGYYYHLGRYVPHGYIQVKRYGALIMSKLRNT